ncbi:MAG TPA: Nramp family divalent metal transporter [Solirubrobacteraceae bacterium]|nr:Nramp family divalent metal transporter [Solirubrobacteraceae bacterium]
MTPPPPLSGGSAEAAVALPPGVLGPGAAEAYGPSRLETLLQRGRLRATLAMLGPAFVAAVAYVDPGNFATNVEGGARFGYGLLWVVLAANLIAMLIQYLSAKLGIVTDRNLPELCRERYPKAVSLALWVQAEVIAMATDIAEFLGAALGLNLLFGVPLLSAGLMAGAIVFAILALQAHGVRRFELAIVALLGIIFLGFLYETLRIGPSASGAAEGLVPSLGGSSAVYLAIGIIGATVMPHVIYLHSALTNGRMPCRDDRERSRVLRFERLDVLIALGLAGVVNLAMLAVAAKMLHASGHDGVSSIGQAHAAFGHLVGGGAALAFAIALLASGASSSSVGTYAGQVVMSGFVGRRIPLLLRRTLTMAPAIVILAIGVDPTSALVLSQVVLSFGIPFALIPLVLLTSNREVMGVHVNGRATTIAAFAFGGLIVALNMFLLAQLL